MCYLGNKAQKELLVTVEHRRDCVPGAVLALDNVGLASQVGDAAGVPGLLLQSSSHLQRQLQGLLTWNGCWREQPCH
jgi:hypothetical protein